MLVPHFLIDKRVGFMRYNAHGSMQNYGSEENGQPRFD